MDVTLSPEQELVRQTADSLAQRFGTAQPRELDHIDTMAGWEQIARTGFLGLAIPDSSAEVPGTKVEAGLVIERLAYHMSPIPFLGSAVLALDLLVHAGASSDVLETSAQGRPRLGIGFDRSLQRVASCNEGALILDADVDAVLTLGSDGEPVALDPASATPVQSIDLSRSVLELNAAERVDIGDLGGPLSTTGWTLWHALALSAVCADIVGVMAGGLHLAVEHAKSRIQFDVPIGSFQAIQHILADQEVSVEASRSATLYALWAVDNRPPDDALAAARVAKVWCSDASRQVSEAVIQVHGAIAITMECLAHLYLRRALFDAQLLGDVDFHLPILAAERYGDEV